MATHSGSAATPSPNAEAQALERLIGFGRELRRRGLAVGTGRILTFCRATASLGAVDRVDLYWAGRALIFAPGRGAFDRLRAWFGRRPDQLDMPAPRAGRPSGSRILARRLDVGEDSVARAVALGEGGDGGEPRPDRVTPRGPPRCRSRPDRGGGGASLTDRRLAIRVPVRKTRRYRPAASGARFDVKRTLRRSLRTQGEPFHRAWRVRGTRSRPLVLVLDISGSMAPYSRALVQFGFAAMAAGRRVEVFCFGTRLTRVTPR
jgi:uncharacterized protein with von Willebrand factor type A (vWA) domain